MSEEETDRRIVAWFSCGAASAVATRLALAERPETIPVVIDVGSEHPDNERFIADCEKWFDRDIIRLKSDKYVDTWDVYEKTRYLVGPSGARCTTELKKKVRQKFELPTDLQVFGFTFEERERERDDLLSRIRELMSGLRLLSIV